MAVYLQYILRHTESLLHFGLGKLLVPWSCSRKMNEGFMGSCNDSIPLRSRRKNVSYVFWLGQTGYIYKLITYLHRKKVMHKSPSCKFTGGGQKLHTGRVVLPVGDSISKWNVVCYKKDKPAGTLFLHPLPLWVVQVGSRLNSWWHQITFQICCGVLLRAPIKIWPTVQYTIT